MEFVKIAGACAVAALGYGILHDEVTAHACIEYFTIGRPPTFATTDPLRLALGWGALESWWLGLPLGVLLAAAARLGRRRRLSLAQLLPWIFGAFALTGLCAVVAPFALLSGNDTGLRAPFALAGLSAAHLQTCREVAVAHLTSYVAGTLAGLGLLAATAVRRLLPGRA